MSWQDDPVSPGGWQSDPVEGGAPTGSLWQNIKSIPGGIVRGLSNAAAPLAQSEQGAMGQVPDAPDAAAMAGQLEKNVTGALPNEGRYGRAVGEAIGNPASYVGARGVVSGVVNAARAGLGSEAGAHAAEGTGFETPAAVAGGLLSGAGARTITKPGKLNPEQVIAHGAAAYQDPVVTGVRIQSPAAGAISQDITGQLNAQRMNPRLAPGTHALVEDLATPVQGNDFHTIEDFQTTRSLLGKLAGNYSNPVEQAAASKAIDLLDQHLTALPQSQLLQGNIAAANSRLAQGRGDYAAGKSAERVQKRVDDAELQAASTYSGGNLDNATRQKLRPILTNPSQGRGLSPEELGSLDQVVRGSPTGNVLRATGRAMGGGGGIGTLVAAGEGARALGPIGAAIPVAGYGLRKAGEILTQSGANRSVQQILRRAPSASTLAPPRVGTGATINSPVAAMISGLTARQNQSQ